MAAHERSNTAVPYRQSKCDVFQQSSCARRIRSVHNVFDILNRQFWIVAHYRRRVFHRSGGAGRFSENWWTWIVDLGLWVFSPQTNRFQTEGFWEKPSNLNRQLWAYSFPSAYSHSKSSKGESSKITHTQKNVWPPNSQGLFTGFNHSFS